MKTLDSASFATEAVKAYGDVGAAYSTFLTNPGRLLSLEVTNDTDAGIKLSFNGTDNHYTVLAGTTLTINLSALNLCTTANLSGKRLSGAPTSGNVYISGIYV